MPTDTELPQTALLRAYGGVLVTRPQQQAGKLARLIEANGGTAIRVPMLIIEAVDAEVSALRDRIGDFQRLIFTSANAVSHFPGALTPLPSALQLFAMGAATVDALAAHRVVSCTSVVGLGSGAWSSETLLATEPFTCAHVEGARILIVTGEGGRGLLHTALRQRGATVESLAVYRRVAPPAAATAALLRAQRQHIGAVIITSTQSLRHLFALDDGLADRVFVVSSERIAASARRYGIRRIEVARQVNDAALVEALGRAAGM